VAYTVSEKVLARNLRRQTWDSRLSDILDGLQQGRSLEDIGSEYGVSRQRVLQIIKRAGVDSVYALKDKRGRKPEICKVCSGEYPYGRYRDHIAEAGHRYMHMTGGRSHDHAAVIADYKSGMRGREIGQKYGFAPEYTYRILSIYGIKPDGGFYRGKRKMRSGPRKP
jgi:hypothetical protein